MTATAPTQTAAPETAPPPAKPAFAKAAALVSRIERVTIPLHPEMERIADFNARMEFAVVIFKSGVAPKGLDSPEKVFAALCLGAELGLAPMYALRNTAVIHNVASLMYTAMHGVVMGTGLLEEYSEEVTDTEARIWIKRAGRPGITSTFTMAEATTAGLPAQNPNYKKYPKRMLRARAGSYGLKQEFPDILAGVYSSEEAEDIEPRTGLEAPLQRTDAEIKAAAQQARAADEAKRAAAMLGRPAPAPAQPPEPPHIADVRAAAKAAGFTLMAKVLAVLSEVAQRPIASPRDLTEVEAANATAHFEGIAKDIAARAAASKVGAAQAAPQAAPAPAATS